MTLSRAFTVCVCVREKEREGDREIETTTCQAYLIHVREGRKQRQKDRKQQHARYI